MDAATFIASLPTFGARTIPPTDRTAILAAEVRLPAPANAVLQVITMRRPFEYEVSVFAIDVSRLPAP